MSVVSRSPILFQLLTHRLIRIEEDSWGDMSERVGTSIVSNLYSSRYSVIASTSYPQESMYIHGIGAAACDVLITISLVAILRSTGTNYIRRSVVLANCDYALLSSESLI